MTDRAPRILVVDDDPAVLDAYRRILLAPPADRLGAARSALFGEPKAESPVLAFAPDVVVVDQGQAAIDAVASATATGGFAMAFVDMRMPPGLDGFTTIERLWTLDSDLQVVIASAYTDVPWGEISARFGFTDRLLFLKKPFDAVEARQMAWALCKKRELLREARQRERSLELRVAERTRELARATRVAQDAAESRLQFLANMSHEIRTPLTAILGFAEMLRDPACGESDRRLHVETIDRNSQHLLQLVNDVLDLSKLEAKQLLVDEQPADLEGVVRDVVAFLQPVAHGKGLGLVVEAIGELPSLLRTDGGRVRQILLNLVGNAIKFTTQGSVTVRVAMADVAMAPWFTIAVVDTGIGIAADRLPNLFEPFVQADSSTSRRFGGTGLGLSISRRLANVLGGNVAVVSESGNGSTFTLALPAGERVVGPLVAWLGARSKGPVAPPVAPRRLRGRVLVAEDGADNQKLLSTILRRAGAEVVLAGDGAQAVRAARDSAAAGTPFDLILMDIQMPVLDGYSATRQLRAEGWRGPIVALTAHAMEGDRDRCLAEGCDGYETKPVRSDRLLATCDRWLTGGAQPDAATPR
jgi:signal transduction histidine kinase